MTTNDVADVAEAKPYYTIEQFACLGCDRTERIAGKQDAPADDQARAKGWRFGVSGNGDMHTYCPRCSGVNKRYWEQVVGVNVGDRAWGTR